MSDDPLEVSLTNSEVINFRQDLIDNFFQKKIRKRKDEWNSVIKIRRKGTFVFDDLSEGHPITENDICSFNLPDYDQNYFENRNILLFDDSIHTGETIQSYIDMFPKANSITVSSIVTSENALDFLQHKYKNVTFVQRFVLDEVNYSKFYNNYMPQYFDYICAPQFTLLNDEFVFSRRLGKDEVIEFFDIGENNLEECELWSSPISYENRFKMVLKFNENEIKKIINEIFPQNINLDISQCKVRFFVHKYEAETKVYVEYIINPECTLPKCGNSLESRYKDCVIGNQTVCLVCYIYNFADLVRKKIMKNLDSRDVLFKVRPLVWFVNGYRIDPAHFGQKSVFGEKV